MGSEERCEGIEEWHGGKIRGAGGGKSEAVAGRREEEEGGAENRFTLKM